MKMHHVSNITCSTHIKFTFCLYTDLAQFLKPRSSHRTLHLFLSCLTEKNHLETAHGVVNLLTTQQKYSFPHEVQCGETYKLRIDAEIYLLHELCCQGRDGTRQGLQLCWQVLVGRILQLPPNRFCKRHFFFVEANTMLFADVPVGRHPHAYLQSAPGRSSASLASCSPTPLRPSPTHGGGTNLRGCHSFRSCCGSWWCWNPVTGCVAIY